MKFCIRKKEPKIYAQIDDGDFDLINSYYWGILRGWNNNGYYAIGFSKTEKPRKRILMHRLIMNPSKDFLIDHINHDTLDNRRLNLRSCTPSQNNMNMKGKGGKSKYKGVSFTKTDKRKKRWLAQMWRNGKRVFSKHFLTEKEAAIAYNKKSLEIYGEFAYINKIKGVDDE